MAIFNQETNIVPRKFRNFTPHAICLNSGEVFESEGVARVSSSHSEFDDNGVCSVEFGEIEGLPSPECKTLIIVSAMVKAANKNRRDLVCPATGHPETIRNEKGHIISVPGFVK